MASSKAKEAQAKNEARVASLEDLKSKSPLRRPVTLYSGDEALTVFVRSIGRKRYSELAEEWTEEVEQDKVDDDGEVVKDKDGNPVKEKVEKLDEPNFFAHLIADSLELEGVTAQDVLDWSNEWNAAEFDELALAAFEVNTRHKVNTLGND